MLDKTVLVTGAGSGIGRSCALALAEAGFTTVLAGRRQDALDQTAALIQDTTPDATCESFATDVTDSDSVRRLFEFIKQRYGRLDVLFNNAGVGAPNVPLDELTDDDWRSCVDTNLTGAFYCIREAVRLMKAQDPQGGRIINNGSISSVTPRPNSIPYTATKHAVLGLTKSTALDGRPFNIACGQIDIGNTSTEMTAKMAGGVKQADGSTATEPTFDVEHVAQAVVYMASLPLDANVLNLTVMANGMPFVGRG